MTPSVILLFRQNICVTIIWHLFGFLALEQITALQSKQRKTKMASPHVDRISASYGRYQNVSTIILV